MASQPFSISLKDKFLFFFSHEVGHCIVLGFDFLMLVYQLCQLIDVNVDPYLTKPQYTVYIFAFTLKRMEDLFLFYMCMNVLLIFKMVYSIKLILKNFKKYSNTNVVISKMTYGGLIFFNLCFSIV